MGKQWICDEDQLFVSNPDETTDTAYTALPPWISNAGGFIDGSAIAPQTLGYVGPTESVRGAQQSLNTQVELACTYLLAS